MNLYPFRYQILRTEAATLREDFGAGVVGNWPWRWERIRGTTMGELCWLACSIEEPKRIR